MHAKTFEDLKTSGKPEASKGDCEDTAGAA